MIRLVSPFALTLMLAMTCAWSLPAAARADQEPDLRARLAEQAAELRKRRVTSPKMGARHRSALNARIAEIDEALEVLAGGGTLTAEQVAKLLGETPPRPEGRDERIARLEARLERSAKLGARERQSLERQLDALRAGDERVAEVRAPARALELERTTLERRLVSGPKVGQRHRSHMRERIEEIDARLAALEAQEEDQLQVTQAD